MGKATRSLAIEPICRVGYCIAALLMAGPALAVERWSTTAVDDNTAAKKLLADPRAKAPANGLSDGRIAIAVNKLDIQQAWYVLGTGKYGHGVLGDTIEARGLKVQTRAGRRITYLLPETEVFEDITPRIADLDADGTNEVITIRSSLTGGASVTVYGLNGQILEQKASTGFIGISHRWANIAGIDHFAGRRSREIAVVIMPHLGARITTGGFVDRTDGTNTGATTKQSRRTGGRLQFWRYKNGALKGLAEQQPFSNHVIGSREQRLSASADINGDGVPELALPTSNRSLLAIVTLSGRKIVTQAIAELPAPIDKAIIATVKDGETRFTTGLEDGSYHEIHR